MSSRPDTTGQIRHLVLTGGPGAGTSSALSYLTEQLTGRGWRVLTVPEAATLLIGGGMHDIGLLARTDRVAYLGVQAQLARLQIDLRTRYDRLAAALGVAKTVVLHDRGVADDAACMTAAEYEQMLTGLGMRPGELFELYDTVVHLRSAAVAGDGYDGTGRTTRPARVAAGSRGAGRGHPGGVDRAPAPGRGRLGRQLRREAAPAPWPRCSPRSVTPSRWRWNASSSCPPPPT